MAVSTVHLSWMVFFDSESIKYTRQNGIWESGINHFSTLPFSKFATKLWGAEDAPWNLQSFYAMNKSGWLNRRGRRKRYVEFLEPKLFPHARNRLRYQFSRRFQEPISISSSACVLVVLQYALVKSYGVSTRCDSRHQKSKNLRLSVSVSLNTLELSAWLVKKFHLRLHGDKLQHAFFTGHHRIFIFWCIPVMMRAWTFHPWDFYVFLSVSTVLIFWMLFFWEYKIFTFRCLALWYHHILMLSGLYFVERVDFSTFVFFGRNERPFFLDTVFKDNQSSTDWIFFFQVINFDQSYVSSLLSSLHTFDFWVLNGSTATFMFIFYFEP